MEFIVAERVDDDSRPWAKLSYFADSKEEVCPAGPGEPGCDNHTWWAKYLVQDEESGLHIVQFTAVGDGSGEYMDSIYYRYRKIASSSFSLAVEYQILA